MTESAQPPMLSGIALGQNNKKDGNDNSDDDDDNETK